MLVNLVSCENNLNHQKLHTNMPFLFAKGICFGSEHENFKQFFPEAVREFPRKHP